MFSLVWIMPPRMRTRSAGRPVAESIGGGTGERVVEVGGVEDLGEENVRNVLVNGNRVGCSYKEFLACNPKEYDGKGGAVVLTRWIEKMESVQDISGCSIDQKVKYTVGSFIEEFCPSHEMHKLETELWNHAMVEASHTAYTDRFYELARMVAATEPKTMQKAMQISSALIDEAVRNGSIKKVEKRVNMGEHSKENAGAWPKYTTCNSYHAPGGSCRTCFNYNRPGHLERDCRVVPRNVNSVNVWYPTPARGSCHECGSTDHLKPACPRLDRAQGLRGNRPNQIAANNGGQGCGNQGNQDRGIEPSELGFRYEIKIASGQLVEIDKVIKGSKLEIEGHVFIIDLIPFGHGSFDVIIGEIPEEKARLLMSAKASDKKQEEIVVVRDFIEVIPDDLSGLPPLWEIEFRIELIPRVVMIAKSPYHVAPSELEELSGQLKEL
ncbi:putative reverse transcriptase domain-containing protein [Tanacetum coccineum]